MTTITLFRGFVAGLAGAAFAVWALSGSTVAGVLCVVATINVIAWEAQS